MESNGNPEAQTPTELLAARIRRRLLEEGFLSEERIDPLLVKIKAGKAKAEDWKLAIELSLDPKNS